MVRAGFGVGVNGHSAGPQLLRADAGEIDRRLAVHALGGRHVGIELVAGNHAHAIVLPAIRIMRMIVVMVMRMMVMAVVGTAHCLAFVLVGLRRQARRMLQRKQERETGWPYAIDGRQRSRPRKHRRASAPAGEGALRQRQNADVNDCDGDDDARGDEQVIDRGRDRERRQKGWSGVCHARCLSRVNQPFCDTHHNPCPPPKLRPHCTKACFNWPPAPRQGRNRSGDATPDRCRSATRTTDAPS